MMQKVAQVSTLLSKYEFALELRQHETAYDTTDLQALPSRLKIVKEIKSCRSNNGWNQNRANSRLSLYVECYEAIGAVVFS